MSFPLRIDVLAVIAVASALGGCADIYSDRRESISLGAGDAVATNKVTHMVDPWPANVGNRNIAFNGERMQAAQERYRHNKVIQPVGIATSSAAYPKPAQEAPVATSAGTSAAAAAPVRAP